ncbi:MAG: CBS domain-containing protein [Verrucomicrobiota bacterium JB023]|nr:CBS domain-containing protein [Verrucomicrobiota bacterium JB023]
MSNTPRIRRIESASDRKAFATAALAGLKEMEEMLGDGAFESGVRRVGAEQELDFVDSEYRPALLAPEILEHLGDGPFVTEYAKFNLEINSEPHLIEGDVFQRLGNELNGNLEHVAQVAKDRYDANVILTGLLPTIRRHDVRPDALTPSPRYKTMLALVNQLRGKEYEFHIQGIDELVTRDNPTAFGGTFTSFQVHCQTDAELLPAQYNWAQMISAPILACATNSPLFLNRRLWRETRIALFAQTTDTRRPEANLRGEQPRVSFGRDWVRGDALELFREDLSRYRAYVTPFTEGNEVDDLEALAFHCGTIYRWNRLCFGAGSSPHLRIENRILPAGPTLLDELANTAFWLGLMLGMPEEAHELPEKVKFTTAHANFNKAARSGLGVTFDWFGESISARRLIIERLLPIARQGLDSQGVDPDESGRLLGIIADRVESGQTGSEWILQAYDHLNHGLSPGEAATQLTAEMHARAKEGEPVHRWDPLTEKSRSQPLPCDASWTLEQVMDSDLITIHIDECWDYVAQVMSWNQREFLPVLDDSGHFKGLISRRDVLDAIVSKKEGSVEELIKGTSVTLPLEASIDEALQLMNKSGVDCVAVMESGALAGLVTGRDIVRIAPNMLAESSS